MTRYGKLSFCVKCACARPTFKDYLYSRDGQKKSRYKVTICAVCRERVYPTRTRGNVPTLSKHTGRMFQSKKEANREPALIAMQNVGAICELRYQVPYKLEVYGTQVVDELLEWVDLGLAKEFARASKMTDAVRRSRHKIATYVADFVYQDKEGNVVVEDVKGYRERIYLMKKRLMLACHGIEIVEPSDYGVEQRARGAGVSGAHTGSRLKGGT